MGFNMRNTGRGDDWARWERREADKQEGYEVLDEVLYHAIKSVACIVL